MRLLHTADLHIGLTRFGQSHDDLRAVCTRLVEAAEEHNVDYAVIAGDLFDSRNPSPRSMALAAEMVSHLRRRGLVVVTTGNHDGPHVLADVESHTLKWLDALALDNVSVPLLPTLFKAGEAVFVTIPYPHKRAFDVERADLDPQARHEHASRQLEEGIATLAERARRLFPDEPIIFVGHLTAVGAQVGSERTMRLEDDLSAGSYVFQPFTYAALGHIHKQQPLVGVRGWYAGSPHYVDFGEAGQRKGFLLVDDLAGVAAVRHIDSGARPMFDYRNWFEPPSDMPEGALVRVTIEGVRVGRTDMQAIEQAFRKAGAHYVEVRADIVRAQASQRAVAADAGPEEALRRYLRLNGLPDEPYVSRARELMV